MLGHSIDFKNTKAMAKCNNLEARITRDAIEINKRPLSMNKGDDTQRPSTTRKPISFEQRISKPNLTKKESRNNRRYLPVIENSQLLHTEGSQRQIRSGRRQKKPAIYADQYLKQLYLILYAFRYTA
ncbi:hypothetical protein Trydic_g7094 [Trypoxylus dichotomus]